jgi:hypothetical protein
MDTNELLKEILNELKTAQFQQKNIRVRMRQ